MGRPIAHQVDESVFSTITNESAYWIGFLMADGVVTQRQPHHQPHIKLALHAKDKKHVQKFRDFVRSDAPIREYLTNNGKTPVVEFQLCSQRIANDLALYGVVQRKSLTAKALRLENNRHFWRGVIDGDGWIGTPVRKGIELVGAKPLLDQFCAWCGQLNLGPLPKSTIHKTIYRVRLPQRFVIPVLKELYQSNDVCLERKKERAQLLLPYYNSSN